MNAPERNKLAAAVAELGALPMPVGIPAELDRLREENTQLHAQLARIMADDVPVPDPLAYGPTGYRCGCGKDAHSNLVPCHPSPAENSHATPRDLPEVTS